MTPVMTPLSWNANTLDRGGRFFRSEFRGKWINYLSEAGHWQKIEAPLSARRNDASPWRIELPELATGAAEFCSANIWNPRFRCSQRQTHAPFSIRAIDVSPVEPVFLSSGEAVYRNAFADGAHLVYRLQQRRGVELEKIVTLEKTPDHDVSFSWIVETPADVRPRRLRSGAIGFFYGDDEFCGFSIKKAIAWDDFGHRVPISAAIQRVSLGIWKLKKTLTREQSSKLVGRCFLDITFTGYPDPDTGATTVDGRLTRGETPPDATWSLLRDGVGTDTFPATAGDDYCGFITGTSEEYASLNRSIFTIDTSSIPAEGGIGGSVISSAVFSVYGTVKNESDVTSAVTIVNSTPAANNDLGTSDYSNLGSAGIGSEISNSAFSTAGYNNFTISDFSAIVGGGITKLGLRESNYDLNDVDPGDSKVSEFQGYYADQTGTEQDPKLVVEYEIAGDVDFPADDTGRSWWAVMHPMG